MGDTLRDVILTAASRRARSRRPQPGPAAPLASPAALAWEQAMKTLRNQGRILFRVRSDVQPFIRRMESLGRQMNDAAYLHRVKRRELAEARDWFDQHVQDIYDDLGLERPTP